MWFHSDFQLRNIQKELVFVFHYLSRAMKNTNKGQKSVTWYTNYSGIPISHTLIFFLTS